MLTDRSSFVLFIDISFYLLLVTLSIFSLRNLVGLLNSIKPKNRKVNKNLLWLLLLIYLRTPLMLPIRMGKVSSEGIETFLRTFNYFILISIVVFQFYFVVKVADSIKSEYEERNIYIKNTPTLELGLASCIAAVLSLLSELPYVKSIGLFFVFLNFVFSILYWIKTYKIKKRFLKPHEQLDDSSIFKDL